MRPVDAEVKKGICLRSINKLKEGKERIKNKKVILYNGWICCLVSYDIDTWVVSWFRYSVMFSWTPGGTRGEVNLRGSKEKCSVSMILQIIRVCTERRRMCTYVVWVRKENGVCIREYQLNTTTKTYKNLKKKNILVNLYVYLERCDFRTQENIWYLSWSVLKWLGQICPEKYQGCDVSEVWTGKDQSEKTFVGFQVTNPSTLRCVSESWTRKVGICMKSVDLGT